MGLDSLKQNLYLKKQLNVELGQCQPWKSIIHLKMEIDGFCAGQDLGELFNGRLLSLFIRRQLIDCRFEFDDGSRRIVSSCSIGLHHGRLHNLSGFGFWNKGEYEF